MSNCKTNSAKKFCFYENLVPVEDSTETDLGKTGQLLVENSAQKAVHSNKISGEVIIHHLPLVAQNKIEECHLTLLCLFFNDSTAQLAPKFGTPYHPFNVTQPTTMKIYQAICEK